MTGPRNDGGFTLLEVLVSLVVLGLLMAGLAGGVRFGMVAWNAQDRAIAGHDELDAVDRTLRQMIERADPGSQAHPGGVAGDAGRLALQTILPGAGQPVDVAIGVDKASRLTLRWTPRRFGKPFGPPPPGREADLLDGVEGVRFSYWPRGAQGGWQTVWNSPDPPALVRVSLRFADRARHWPDIVAFVARDRVQ